MKKKLLVIVIYLLSIDLFLIMCDLLRYHCAVCVLCYYYFDEGRINVKNLKYNSR